MVTPDNIYIIYIYIHTHTYIRMNVSMYGKMYGYAASYFNLKAPRMF